MRQLENFGIKRPSGYPVIGYLVIITIYLILAFRRSDFLIIISSNFLPVYFLFLPRHNWSYFLIPGNNFLFAYEFRFFKFLFSYSLCPTCSFLPLVAYHVFIIANFFF